MWRVWIGLLAGCGGEPEDDSDPTWHGDIAQLASARCAKCHTLGGAAPFAIDSYEEMVPWATLALAKIEGDDEPPFGMPPWFALDTPECTPPAPWKGDERLTLDEIATFRAWVEAGTPEGKPVQGSERPLVPTTELPNATRLEPRTPFSMSADADDMYHCVSLDPELSQDGWITGLQVDPDVDAIVHHVVVFADPTGASATLGGAEGGYPCFGSAGVPNESVIFAWAPGSEALEVPAQAGISLPVGARLVAQMHYHAYGEEALDATAIEVQITHEKPARTARMEVIGVVSSGDRNDSNLVDPPFSVPAGVADHQEVYRQIVDDVGPVDARIWSVFSHMHLAGTDIRVSIDQPDGEVCLAHNPSWDFEWQRTYVYDGAFEALPKISDGDVVEIRCTFNNTMDNPVLASGLAKEGLDVPMTFEAGEDTLDEMCTTILGVVY